MINNILLTVWSRVFEKLTGSQFMEPEGLYPAWGGRGVAVDGTTEKIRQIEVTENSLVH